jgi:hypothetical protein
MSGGDCGHGPLIATRGRSRRGSRRASARPKAGGSGLRRVLEGEAEPLERLTQKAADVHL